MSLISENSRNLSEKIVSSWCFVNLYTSYEYSFICRAIQIQGAEKNGYSKLEMWPKVHRDWNSDFWMASLNFEELNDFLYHFCFEPILMQHPVPCQFAFYQVISKFSEFTFPNSRVYNYAEKVLKDSSWMSLSKIDRHSSMICRLQILSWSAYDLAHNWI